MAVEMEVKRLEERRLKKELTRVIGVVGWEAGLLGLVMVSATKEMRGESGRKEREGESEGRGGTPRSWLELGDDVRKSPG